jgi:hypothetical protein
MSLTQDFAIGGGILGTSVIRTVLKDRKLRRFKRGIA